MVKYLKERYEIEDPHFSKEYTAEIQEGDYTQTVNSLMVAVRMDLDNVTRAAIQQAADVYRNKSKVVQSEIKYMALTGKLVLCSPFVESIVEDKRCSFVLSNNEQVEDRMVVLTKIDPFNLGEYSLMPFAADDQTVGIRFAVKFDFSDVQGAATYIINDGY